MKNIHALLPNKTPDARTFTLNSEYILLLLNKKWKKVITIRICCAHE
jgi:hypothetical protein